MQVNLAFIREAIALAQKHHARLKETAPTAICDAPELDELEMGLEWSMKRVVALQDLINVDQNAEFLSV